MIRTMRGADIEGAMRLKQAAGWNQTVQDWERLLRLEPDGCFVEERDGVIAGSATALRYSRELAWIGMVLVLPGYRRRGIATALMRHALAWLGENGILVSKLDATDMGRPLYEQLGFRKECAIERWARAPLPSAREDPAAGIPAGKTGPFFSGLRSHMGLDRLAFGCNRQFLLRELASETAVETLSSRSGFAYGRPGSHAWFVGPCVAGNAPAAKSLLGRLIARHNREPIFWDFLPANDSARRLAMGFGFHPVRRLSRMARIEDERVPAPARAERVYATAGFEFG